MTLPAVIRHPWMPVARRTLQTLTALESDAANMDVALQLQLWQVPRLWDQFTVTLLHDIAW